MAYKAKGAYFFLYFVFRKEIRVRSASLNPGLCFLRKRIATKTHSRMCGSCMGLSSPPPTTRESSQTLSRSYSISQPRQGKIPRRRVLSVSYIRGLSPFVFTVLIFTIFCAKKKFEKRSLSEKKLETFLHSFFCILHSI